MSKFCLCDHCKHCKRWTYVDEVLCARRFVTDAKYANDHDEPREVCKDYEPKEER